MARSWRITFEPDLDPRYFSFFLNRIDVYARVIRDMPLAPSARAVIDFNNLARSIRGTAGIDGNRHDTEQVIALLADPPEYPGSAAEQEILNAAAVTARIRSAPPVPRATLDESILADLHSLVTVDCDYAGNKPGAYRRVEHTAGNYKCPPPWDIPPLMTEFTEFINSSAALTMHPAVRAFLAHFYLVSIHPYGAGNGKTARAAEAYLLYNGGYSRAGFDSMSDYYYRHVGEYIEELDKARFEEAGLRDFLVFALQGMEEQFEARFLRVTTEYRPLSYAAYLEDLVAAGAVTPRLANIARRLAAAESGVSLRRFRDRALPWLADAYRGLSERSVRNDLTILRKLGLVTESAGIIYASFRALES